MNEDALTQQYLALLDGCYDCVDRIIVSAYFEPASSGGGFRYWWRKLHGTDENLNDTHLMRMAGKFGKRLYAWAKKHDVPVLHCDGDERKHELVSEQYLPQDPQFKGVFCVIVSRAPGYVRKVDRFGHVYAPKPRPFVNHYHFHIMDPQWGHLTVRLCSHPPFYALVILNGHEWVEREALAQGIGFVKQDNCFVHLDEAAKLNRLADAMKADGFGGRVAQVCDRWIYTACLNFGLNREQQQRSDFRYQYSLHQAEFSRNLLFTRGRVMERVFNSIIDHARTPLQIKTIKTIFGRKKRPYHRHGKQFRIECVTERPVYDLTIFKIHFGRLTVKIYTKGERVLRIESIAHNTYDLQSGRGLAICWGKIVRALEAILERFVAVLEAVDAALLDEAGFQTWHEPTRLGAVRLGGVDVNRPRIRAAMEALIALNLIPKGFCLQEFAQQVAQILNQTDAGYGKRQAAYDLKKFRGKALVERIPGTRRYQATLSGLSQMTAFLVLRDKVLGPMISAAGKEPKVIPIEDQNDLNACYRRMQAQMLEVFDHLGLVA